MQSFGAGQFQIDAAKSGSPVKTSSSTKEASKKVDVPPPLPPAASEQYEIFYHVGFTGRSLPIQLLLRDAGVPYTVLPVVHGGADRVVGALQGYPVFAPPAIKKGNFVLAQTTAILSYLGKKHGAAPTSDEDLAKCDQLNADVADVFVETLNAYKADKGAAFIAPGGRLAQWLAHFDKALGVSAGPFFFGENPSFADFHLLSLIDALQFFFDDRFAPLVPERMTNWLGASVCRNSYMAIQAEGSPILPPSFK